MHKRIKMLILCLVSLILGVVLYTFFRSETYIGKLAAQILGMRPYPANLFTSISYYLPDFLWGFSLCSGLFSVYPLKSYVSLCWGVLTFLYGTIWELLQKVSIVSGTFDVIDIFMYLAAASAVVIINFYFNKEKEK